MSTNLKPPQSIGDYVFSDKIGQGGFSAVFKGFHLATHQTVAIKMIDKVCFPEDKFQRELEIMKSLDHPFCAAFFEFLEDDQHYYLVMEHIDGGNLFSIINSTGSLPEWKSRHYFCQLVSAIDYLHSELKIAHRDLKVENVMIDRNDNVRLIDFGLGNMFRGENAVLQTACGSPAYAPPEMYHGKPYTTSADIWSLGIVLYAMVCGRLPFGDMNIQKLVMKIVTEEPIYPDKLPPQLRDILQKMLTKDPQNRITIQQMMQHPWFQQYYFVDKMNASFGIAEQFRMFVSDTFSLNDDVIKTMQNLGLDNQTIQEIIDKIQNKVFDSMAAYYRILNRSLTVEKMKGLSENAYQDSETGEVHFESFNLRHVNSFNRRKSLFIQKRSQPCHSPTIRPIIASPKKSLLSNGVPIATPQSPISSSPAPLPNDNNRMLRPKSIQNPIPTPHSPSQVPPMHPMSINMLVTRHNALKNHQRARSSSFSSNSFHPNSF